MRIFHEPKVILVARPSLVPEGVGALLQEYGESPVRGWRRADGDGDGDGLPELMGRLCYGSFGARQGRVGATAYLGHVVEAGHGSVLEHACLSFVVCRASRAFTHQMVRHRAGVSPSQESQHFVRYTAEDDERPLAQEAGICLTGIPEALWPLCLRSAEASVASYAEAWVALRATGLAKKESCELARGLLPNCLESRLGLTMNARAIRHFCELRCADGNAIEIRLVAARVAEIAMEEMPAAFGDFRIAVDARGLPTVESGYRKV